MGKILIKCGYYVGNESGKQNFKINIADFFMFTVYFILSFINLFSSKPSIMMFALNVISIIRLIFKNYIEQSKIVEKYPVNNEYSPIRITLIHMLKIVVETISLVLLIIFICWSRAMGEAYAAVKLMALMVLIVNWLENLIGMIERLYDAQPFPYEMCDVNNL